MSGRIVQAAGLACLLLTAVVAIHTRWIQEPPPPCPDDTLLKSLPVFSASLGEVKPPSILLRKKSELRVRGELAPDADGRARLWFHLGRGRNPSWYLVSGLALKLGLALPTDFEVRDHLDVDGERLPISFREHRATRPNFVTGYLYLLDGEPVANLATAAVRHAVRNPLGPPATTVAIALTYLEGGYEELQLRRAVSDASDAPHQKAEIKKWLGRFYSDIRSVCNP